MPTEVELRRLAFIKYLYKLGMEQSKQPEPMSSTSLLSFHDAIELFLQLTADHVQVPTSRDTKLLDYWEITKPKLPSELSQKASAKRLNDARVGLKHYGRLPSKMDIEEYRATSTNFLKDNTKLVFDVDFEQISLIDLIQYAPARDALKEASSLIVESKRESGLQKIAIAFDMLIEDYERRKQTHFRYSPFFFGPRVHTRSSYMMGIKGDLGDFVEEVSEAVGAIQEAMKVLSLGIDYRRYSRFRLIAPEAVSIGTDYIIDKVDNEAKHSLEDANFCLDFVIDSAIKLQDFDYNVQKVPSNQQTLFDLLGEKKP